MEGCRCVVTLFWHVVGRVAAVMNGTCLQTTPATNTKRAMKTTIVVHTNFQLTLRATVEQVSQT